MWELTGQYNSQAQTGKDTEYLNHTYQKALPFSVSNRFAFQTGFWTISTVFIGFLRYLTAVLPFINTERTYIGKRAQMKAAKAAAA